MGVYERVLSRLLGEALKNIPGLDIGSTKLTTGLLLSDDKFKYTIVKIDRKDPKSIQYTLRSYGRDGSSYGDRYEKTVNSDEIKKYKLG